MNNCTKAKEWEAEMQPWSSGRYSTLQAELLEEDSTSQQWHATGERLGLLLGSREMSIVSPALWASQHRCWLSWRAVFIYKHNTLRKKWISWRRSRGIQQETLGECPEPKDWKIQSLFREGGEQWQRETAFKYKHRTCLRHRFSLSSVDGENTGHRL